jgi:hypothetical protein
MSRPVALVAAGSLAVLIASAAAAILAIAIGISVGIVVDWGRVYEEGEVNYGLGMGLGLVVCGAFVFLVPVLTFLGWRVLAKRFDPQVASSAAQTEYAQVIAERLQFALLAVVVVAGLLVLVFV